MRTRASDLIGGSDVLAGSPPGKAWTLDALVKAMIHVSDNAASNTLITAFGMDTDQRHHAAGRHDRLAPGPALRRRRPELARQRERHHAGRHRELLYAIERGAREGLPTIASPQSCRAMIEVLFGNDDGSKIVRGLPPGTPCAHKTGEIDGVRNDAAIVDPFGDTPYVLVVLTKGLRDQAAGNAGIAAIARRVDAALRPPA